MVTARALPRTYCAGGTFRPGMPISAKLLPCSSLSCSGLYITGKLVPVVVLTISALASSLLTGADVGRAPNTGRVISGTPLELVAQLPHQVADDPGPQRVDVDLWLTGRRHDGRSHPVDGRRHRPRRGRVPGRRGGGRDERRGHRHTVRRRAGRGAPRRERQG